MIDNFDKILPLLVMGWESHSEPLSFHVQILQRSKDGHDKSSRLIAEWFIGSEQRFNFLIPAMKSLCNSYDARCYINLNPKRDETVMWKMLKNIAERLETKSYSPYSVISSAHDSCNGYGLKLWIVDVDDPNVDKGDLYSKINSCKSGVLVNTVAEIPTKNGYHIITHPFNLSQIQLPSGVEIKKNNSTLLYYP